MLRLSKHRNKKSFQYNKDYFTQLKFCRTKSNYKLTFSHSEKAFSKVLVKSSIG